MLVFVLCNSVIAEQVKRLVWQQQQPYISILLLKHSGHQVQPQPVVSFYNPNTCFLSRQYLGVPSSPPSCWDQTFPLNLNTGHNEVPYHYMMEPHSAARAMADLAALSVCCPAARSSGLADGACKQDNQIIWLNYFTLGPHIFMCLDGGRTHG